MGRGGTACAWRMAKVMMVLMVMMVMMVMMVLRLVVMIFLSDTASHLQRRKRRVAKSIRMIVRKTPTITTWWRDLRYK